MVDWPGISPCNMSACCCNICCNWSAFSRAQEKYKTQTLGGRKVTRRIVKWEGGPANIKGTRDGLSFKVKEKGAPRISNVTHRDIQHKGQ